MKGEEAEEEDEKTRLLSKAIASASKHSKKTESYEA